MIFVMFSGNWLEMVIASSLEGLRRNSQGISWRFLTLSELPKLFWPQFLYILTRTKQNLPNKILGLSKIQKHLV